MDERDGAISDDFVNKSPIGAYNVFYDDDQQDSTGESSFGLAENNGNGLHAYAPDDQAGDTTDSMQFFSAGLSKITSRFAKREPPTPPARSPASCEHLKPDFKPTILTKPKDLNYSMDYKRRGKCVIINNTYFDSPTLGERKGTQVDRDDLTRCFKKLDFDVQNWDEKEALDIRIGIDKLSREDFSDHDCLVICVLTHGEANHLYAKDDKYCIEYLFDAFKSDVCKTLAGKPKIFIIQACRGDRLDNGTILNFDVEDSSSSDVRIPQWADFLMAYSTVPGYYSWRNTSNGSWFIQAFVAAMEEHNKDLDLLSIFTIVNQKVAYDFESNTPNLPEFHQRKQIPMIASMLTHKLYFNVPKSIPRQMRMTENNRLSNNMASSPGMINSFNQLSLNQQQLELHRKHQLGKQEAILRHAQEMRRAQELQEKQKWQQQQLQRQAELARQKETLYKEQLQKTKQLTKESFLRDQLALNQQMINSGRLKSPEN